MRKRTVKPKQRVHGFGPRMAYLLDSMTMRTTSVAEESLMTLERVEEILAGSDASKDEVERIARAMFGLLEDFIIMSIDQWDAENDAVAQAA